MAATIATKQGGSRRKSDQNIGCSEKWLEAHHNNKQSFAEELFNTTFAKENIEKLVNDLKTVTEAKVAESQRLLDEDFIYTLQVTSRRRPHVPIHLTRVMLPHSILAEDATICLFVKDLVQRGRKSDYEQTIKHYENLFRTKKIDHNIVVIPISQLYNEYPTFEQRRKLTFLFDKFLVDEAISTPVNAFIGHKLLQDARCAFPIDMNNKNIVEELDNCLRKVYYTYKSFDDKKSQNIKVGRHSMSNDKIADNIIDFLNQLATVHPGGTKNIHKLHIKPNVNVSNAVEFYVDESKPEFPPKVEKPVVEGEEKPADGEATADGETLPEDEEKINENLLERVSLQFQSIIGNDYLTWDYDDASEEEDNVHFDKIAFEPMETDPPAKINTVASKPTKSTTKTTETSMEELVLRSIKKLLGQGGVSGIGGSRGGGGGGGVTSNNAIRNRKRGSRGINRSDNRSGVGNVNGSSRNRRFI